MPFQREIFGGFVGPRVSSDRGRIPPRRMPAFTSGLRNRRAGAVNLRTATIDRPKRPLLVVGASGSVTPADEAGSNRP